MLNATTTCQVNDSGTVCLTQYGQSTSTDPTIVQGFTAGELVISTLLFITLAVISVLTYHVLFRRIKIKNK